MNVRFKKTDKGEIAILPRKEYEALAAKATEADEDIGGARLVARARVRRSQPALRLFRRRSLTASPTAKTRCASCASGAR
jgi:hypothetical protein